MRLSIVMMVPPEFLIDQFRVWMMLRSKTENDRVHVLCCGYHNVVWLIGFVMVINGASKSMYPSHELFTPRTVRYSGPSPSPEVRST